MAALNVGRTTVLDADTSGMRMDGPNLSVSGFITATSTAVTAAARQQLLALTQPGQDVVPLTWATDPTWDGFYRVTSVQVEHYTQDSLVVRFALQATRLDGYAAAQFESTAVLGTITNGLSLPSVANAGIVAIPGTSYEATQITTLSTGVGTGVGFTGSRTVEGGTVATASGLTPPTTVGYRYATTPANFYEGAAMVEVQGTDGVWRPHIGTDAIPITVSWRISNSLYRLSVAQATGLISVEVYNGTSWDPAKVFYINTDIVTPTVLDRVNSIRPVRNRPESVTVRVGMYRSTFATYASREYVDITLRRGMMFADLFMGGSSYSWALRRQTNEAATAITGGIRATAADAVGNFYWIATPVSSNNELTIGRVVVSVAATTAQFGLGLFVNGTTGDPAAEVNRWIISTSERHQVVSR